MDDRQPDHPMFWIFFEMDLVDLGLYDHMQLYRAFRMAMPSRMTCDLTSTLQRFEIKTE